MGLRGPKPKPEELRQLEGYPGHHRPPNPRVPKPERGAPSAPSWISREARAEWRRVVPELERLGLLAKIDRALLAAYCEAWSDYHAATKLLAAEGRITYTDKGNVIQHPAVGMKNKAADLVRKLAAEFGLSPAARARLEVAPAEEAPGKGAGRFFEPQVVHGGKR